MVLHVKDAKPDVRIYPDLAALSQAVARTLVEQVNSSIAGGGIFSLVLAGGNTPRALYRLLSGAYRDRIPWQQVHVFWGDERYVPPDDPRSNYRMAEESLLSQVPIPPGNVHPMPTSYPLAEEEAGAYESVLRAHFNSSWPRFDLVLLGLGAEGHTASLFPGSPALREQQRWVMAVQTPAEPPLRLTLTLPALNHAACVYFLAAGAEKAGALSQAVAAARPLNSCPASMVQPEQGKVVWWADEAAAGLLPPSFGS
jgi:6-phosphogluconolactonase